MLQKDPSKYCWLYICLDILPEHNAWAASSLRAVFDAPLQRMEDGLTYSINAVLHLYENWLHASHYFKLPHLTSSIGKIEYLRYQATLSISRGCLKFLSRLLDLY